MGFQLYFSLSRPCKVNFIFSIYFRILFVHKPMLGLDELGPIRPYVLGENSSLKGFSSVLVKNSSLRVFFFGGI